MKRKEKHYLATFAPGASHGVTYPVTGTSKEKAAEDFSRQYIGRVDRTFMKLVKVTRDWESEEDQGEEE